MASCAALLLLAAPSQAQSALGANFNEDLTGINETELSQAHATWLRGFYPMTWADRGDIAKDKDLLSILNARKNGHKTILSLKWNYTNKDFPAPNSPPMQIELKRLDKVLPQVMGNVDILVIGNEPFIEAKEAQKDERLNVFYEALADYVIAYWKANCKDSCATKLYMGAFNRLDMPGKRTPAVTRMLKYIAARPELSGVDLHPHIPSFQALQVMVDYTLPFLRQDQKFIVTEFSLVWYWKKHMSEAIPEGPAKQYGLPLDMKYHEFINAALKKPVPRQEWVDMLNATPWYTAQSGFLADTMTYFRKTGRLAVATYGFRQAFGPDRPFTAETDPWLLNSVFAASTVERNADGTAQPTVPWFDVFVADQKAHAP
jgi:hypothetical protein